jgi:hypothetical protein
MRRKRRRMERRMPNRSLREGTWWGRLDEGGESGQWKLYWSARSIRSYAPKAYKGWFSSQ